MTVTSPEEGPAFEQLLDHLKEHRGFDFTGYKRSSLQRRVSKRMQEVGVDDPAAYLDHLELHQGEFAALFNTILVNVTSFFRDADAWEFLERGVVPSLLERVGDGPIRVWCAGCASGEETYSLAMVLAEALGDEAFLERVKIYATDVDEEALDVARAGSYPHRAVEGLSERRLARFFERSDQRVLFRKDLRRAIIFGRNDLVQDAPISRIDLLACRNTLMYFNAETQARVLARFSFALNGRGVLFLGKSEMLITHADLFTPVDIKRRVFRKSAQPTFRDRLLTAIDREPRTLVGGVHEVAFELTHVAEVIVDPGGVVVTANRRAQELLGLGRSDVGRPLKDLELSFRPVELRGPLGRVLEERCGERLREVPHVTSAGEERVLDVSLTPLEDRGELLGVDIAFDDVTEHHRVGAELERSKRELENAYEELQSTVEELETTNEELQSTNEELETTNEELQSTNEELETMNEELQSSNEELETINEELRQRSVELDDVNAFMETILSSLRLAVAVIDHDQVVRLWNRQATDLWGLRADEAEGQRLFGLDVGLPLDGLRDAVRTVLAGGTADGMVVEATNRRGRPIACRVAIVPLARAGAPAGAIVVMEQLDEDRLA